MVAVSPPAGSGRRRGAAVAGALGLVLWAGPVVTAPRPAAAEPAEPPLDGSVATITLDALPLGVPLAALDHEARDRAGSVLAGSIFAQRISGLRYRSREAVSRFLLDHPDFAASVARALRFGGYRVTAVDDAYRGDDGRGARGVIRVLYADGERRLYHLAGEYDTRGLPTIRGQMLVLLEIHHEPDGAGGTVADATLTGHLRLDTPVAGGLARIVAALVRPAVEHVVERKVRRFFGRVARLSRWAHDEPEQLLAAIEGHPEVPQDATLEAFRRILLAGRPPVWATQAFRLLPAAPESAGPAAGPAVPTSP